MSGKIYYRKWEIPDLLEKVMPLVRRVGLSLPKRIPSSWRRDLLLAVHEALVNALVHGNRHDPRLKITLEMVRTETDVEIKVTDQGPGFNPKDLPDPTDPDRILLPHGRGVYLMEQLVDTLEIHCGEGTCTAILRKKFPPLEG